MRRLMRLQIMVLTVMTGCMILLQRCTKDPNAPVSGKFIDSRDQREYKWVIIGNQIWMAENLAYLPAVNPSLAGSDTIPYFYVFRFEGSNIAAAKEWEYYSAYGVFYNWPAVLNRADSSSAIPSGVQGICPEGWHLPSDGEWDILVNFLGGQYVAGKKMKSAKGWSSYLGASGNGNNSSGFNALPAGARRSEGGFYNFGYDALFWSSTGFDANRSWSRNPVYTQNGVYRYYSNIRYGFSVRCVKDIY